jgi:hypothetical protein
MLNHNQLGDYNCAKPFQLAQPFTWHSYNMLNQNKLGLTLCQTILVGSTINLAQLQHDQPKQVRTNTVPNHSSWLNHSPSTSYNMLNHNQLGLKLCQTILVGSTLHLAHLQFAQP